MHNSILIDTMELTFDNRQYHFSGKDLLVCFECVGEFDRNSLLSVFCDLKKQNEVEDVSLRRNS